MDVPRQPHPCKLQDRPPACSTCGSDAWWDGWREVTFRQLDTSGRVDVRPGQRLHRATCSTCDAPSWTVYPPGRYPGRHFNLDVVTSAVATAACARDSDNRPTPFTTVARRYACSGQSVSRWTHWLVNLTDLNALARECARLDPDAMPVAPPQATDDVRGQAARALAVFDRLATVLDQRDVLPRNGQPSVVRLLDDQRLRHGVRFPLRGLSPPLSTRTAQTVRHGPEVPT